MLLQQIRGRPVGGDAGEDAVHARPAAAQGATRGPPGNLVSDGVIYARWVGAH